MILPLDEVVGEQRPLDPELYRLAGVLSALRDQSVARIEWSRANMVR